MSEPLKHDKAGPWGTQCAPTCPACREVGRQVRAGERRSVLASMHPIDLLEEVEKRIGALFTENAELRASAQTVADKTERMDRLDNARLDQIKNLERTRRNAENRVRDFRERLGLLAGYVNAPLDHRVSDAQLLNKVQDEIRYLKTSIRELESAASDQDESASSVQAAHEIIFRTVRDTLRIGTESLTVSEAVERLAQAYWTVVKEKANVMENARLRDEARELEMQELRDTVKKLQNQLDELRTAQAPRWYTIDTSGLYTIGRGSRPLQLEVDNLDLASSQDPQMTGYVWLDRDNDPWVWMNGEWESIRRVDGAVRKWDVAPRVNLGPYVCAGLVRPEFTDIEVRSLVDASDRARDWAWTDKDGDIWRWSHSECRWVMNDGSDTLTKPMSAYGSYIRGERVSG